MTSLLTTLTNPDHSICQSSQIRIHYETESRFCQIKYGLSFLQLSYSHNVLFISIAHKQRLPWIFVVSWSSSKAHVVNNQSCMSL